MKKLGLLLCALLLCVLVAPAFADNHSPEGYWLTENERSVIHVKSCGEGLCGSIHWIIDGGMQFDEKNEDEALRDTPMCGLKILSGFRQQNATNWVDGEIYKADDGDMYNATLQLLPKGTMLVRGYVGMPLFGKSQIWKPVNPADYPKCKPAHR